MNLKKQCLIITATIQPNSNFVAQINPSERRNEYLKVLSFYVANFKGDIYFAENSAYNFDEDEEFKLLFDLKNVFCVRFPQSSEYQKGKGYQEFKVLDDIVSKIADNYDEFIKVSGRYLAVNFKSLLNDKLKIIKNSVIDIFNETPIYEGISGSYGASLNRHPLKIKIINIERKLLKFIRFKEFILEY